MFISNKRKKTFSTIFPSPRGPPPSFLRYPSFKSTRGLSWYWSVYRRRLLNFPFPSFLLVITVYLESTFFFSLFYLVFLFLLKDFRPISSFFSLNKILSLMIRACYFRFCVSPLVFSLEIWETDWGNLDSRYRFTSQSTGSRDPQGSITGGSVTCHKMYLGEEMWGTVYRVRKMEEKKEV